MSPFKISLMKVVIVAAFYIAVFLACSGLRVLNLSAVEEIRRFGDTSDYTEKATWPLWLWVWASGLMFGFAFVVAVRIGEPRWFIPLILIMLAYPHAAIVWHGDPNDIGALQAGVHFRLGLWMLLLFAADRTLIHATTARKTHRISVGSKKSHALAAS